MQYSITLLFLVVCVIANLGCSTPPENELPSTVENESPVTPKDESQLAVRGKSAVVDAATDIITRLVKKKATLFHFEKIERVNGKNVFELEGRDGKIVIRGNSAISMACGFNWYLKHVAKCHVSWCGDQLNLPTPLPEPSGIIQKTSITEHGFYLNYCTFNYTMSWWSWERWEREIDFMALCGIDMPLATIGTEAVWLNFLKRFGYTTDEAKRFISGPGYTAWWLMGNLEGNGGPVTDEYIEDRVTLQRKILKRMRELGMKPVLPGFVGLVPSTMAKKLGVKTIPQGIWHFNTRPHVLHPEEKVFGKMASAWYEELDKLYGRADCFAGDLFHEGGRTAGVDIAQVGAMVQKHMLDYNSDAIWTIQGWGSNPKEQLLRNLQKDKILIVELCNEFWRGWERTKGFWDTPWAFSTIIMYGGNVGFHGRLESIRNNLNDALASAHKPRALGATWESIDVNPIVMEYLWDMKWRESCPSPSEWAKDYAVRRYGFDSPEIRTSWEKIVNSVYGSYPGLRRPQESLLCALPSLNVKKASPFSATCKIQYDQRELRDALELLLTASEDCKNERTYRFDVVDVARQFVANTGQIFYYEMVAAFTKGDKQAFKEVSAEFLELLDDQDKLLGCEPLYMLGKWLHDARNSADSNEQADQNERNARLLITTWLPQKSILNNYAWREWNGLMKNYYKPRWQLFIDELASRLEGNPQRNFDFYRADSAWCRKTLKTDFYPNTPEGDAIIIAKELLVKYSPVIDTRYTPPYAAPKEQFVGFWKYPALGATYCRVLHRDGSLDLLRNNVKHEAWRGFTWKYDQQKAMVRLLRKGGKEFGTMKLLDPSRADFSCGYIGLRVEEGENKEAQEAAVGSRE